ncbi:hypothetical protein TREPR_1591 [Treponema primitia ZAS-2]|uniref:Phasin family protein n=1 Tax=Treponema primitia (strain ATCC BAA-887 / DSM 12427 / ZAS-2) TaxID=545694 RepID=F5YNU6_TREPZ|nr:hypothetical protein [Treponema primitia]AEF85866.1 hypothetical protein TREPR_1591 [Treponema primitia ZAS-2]
MTFGDRMKELFEQGAHASKDFALKAGEVAQDLGGKGLQASKEFASKAGAKAQEMGEIGVLKFEIKQYEWQAQKLIGRLGTEAYKRLSEEDAETLSREDTAIKAILAEIASVKAAIEKRENEIQNRKG